MKEAVSECPLEGALLLLSGRWRVLLLYWLSHGAMGFNALRRASHGISHQMLTQELRAIEGAGIVSRTEIPTVPPRVEYALTDAGQRLMPLLQALGDWWQELRATAPDHKQADAQGLHVPQPR